MPIGIVSVKLGAFVGMPSRRGYAALEQGRRDCCKARNAAIEHWLLWRRQHPQWKPGDLYNAPPAKINRKAKPNGKPPKDSPLGPRLFLSRELYAAATTAAPNVAGALASSCVQEVTKRLKANTPYDHDGSARWIWQAILAHEVSVPTWRKGRVPMPARSARLEYDDDHCTLRFPLLSKASGYSTLSPTVRLHAKDLSRGNRRLLRQLADGSRKMLDSAICEKAGKWYARLCYEVPVAACGFATDRVMTLWPSMPEGKRPLRLTWVDIEGGKRSWDLGDGLPLVAEYRRLIARNRAIRYRSRDGCGRGHGKERVYRVLRPITRAVRDTFDRFHKQTIARLIRATLEAECGALVYREPTKPVRERTWFAAQDVPFGWAEFEARLQFKAKSAGLEYNVERVRMAEWLDDKEKTRRAN